MRRGVFWGLLLLAIGFLLLVSNLGLVDFLSVDVWRLVWPLALIAVGVWVLVGSRPRADQETKELSLPLGATAQAEVQIDYGAGELRVGGDAGSSELLAGCFVGGVESRARREGARSVVRITSPSVVLGPWYWGASTRRRWDLRLSERVPLALKVSNGATDTRLDLERLRVTSLRIDSGASSTHVVLPANAGHTEVRGSGGAASLRLRVPDGVAARISTSGVLSSLTVDQQRFQRRGSVYESPGYETAANRVDIRLDIGVGSIDIR